MRIARLVRVVLLGLLLALAVQSLLVFLPVKKADLPWTPLDLRAPIGLDTGSKLAALGGDPPRCRALLADARVGFAPLPPRRDGAACGWTGAVRLTSTVRPQVAMTCPLAAGVVLWMREVVQPAAIDLLGSRVVRVGDLGSYACRRIRGGADGGWSEHASANAIDIAGFRLADGRRISVARDWRHGAGGTFLHAARDGACRLFATILSPDYNAAHRDHLHLDQAARGAMGWRACG